MTQAKRLEGAAYVTANHGDGTEILIDHRDERAVASELRLVARRRVHRRRLVQVAPDLINYPDDIEGLGDCRRRADDIRGGYSRFEDVERGSAVALLQVGATQPSERGETCSRQRIGIPHQSSRTPRTHRPSVHRAQLVSRDRCCL